MAKRKSESKTKTLSDEQVPEDSDEGLSGSEAKPAKKAKTVAKEEVRSINLGKTRADLS